jgi:uncharacterized membrane protein YoaK (UPF0700 family)
MVGETKTGFDPRIPLLLLLSVTTGLVDAASVLGLGKVFTANMTGNVVFLGFAVAGTPGFKAAPFLAAIGSFAIGALIAGRTGKAHVGRTERRWLLTSAVVETTLLWLAAVIALGFDVSMQAPASRLYAIIALTGMAMGYRNATIRQLKVADLTTTVLTLTLTGLSADSSAAGGGNPNWRRRVAAVAAIFLGAAGGGWLLLRVGIAAPLAVAGALVLSGTLACTVHPASRRTVLE